MFISVHLWLLSPVRAQDREVVANLAAGRVVIYVAKGGIVVGAMEEKIEPETRLPAIVPLGSQRLGVLLGAVEWLDPADPEEPVRLDTDLLEVTRRLGGGAPGQLAGEADDIERIGLALMEPLARIAGRIHHKLGLGPEEPLVELVLVGYVHDYGPEVWSLRYRVRQEPLRGDYWRTRILRPQYIQHYPPEKGRPRTLVEVRYPADDAGPALLDLLQRNDPRLAPLAASADPQLDAARTSLARGRSDQAPAAAATQFLRAALDALAPQDARQAVALIDERSGFQWVLAPPEPAEKAGDEKRPPGAPTLHRPPPPPPR